MMHDWNTGFSLHGAPALVVILLVMFLIYGIPVMRIVGRVGFSPWWGLLAALPVVNIVALWVFAFRSWPLDEGR